MAPISDIKALLPERILCDHQIEPCIVKARVAITIIRNAQFPRLDEESIRQNLHSRFQGLFPEIESPIRFCRHNEKLEEWTAFMQLLSMLKWRRAAVLPSIMGTFLAHAQAELSQ